MRGFAVSPRIDTPPFVSFLMGAMSRAGLARVRWYVEHSSYDERDRFKIVGTHPQGHTARLALRETATADHIPALARLVQIVEEKPHG